MLVNRDNFNDAYNKIWSEIGPDHPFIALDTETTTLFWWDSPHYADTPRVFSIQCSTYASDYYFDFGCEETFGTKSALDISHMGSLRAIFEHPYLTWFIHNAKFDMHHLKNHDVEIAGTVHCTQSIQRLVNNQENDKGFSLDALSEKYLGAGKIDLTSYFSVESGRVTKVKRPGDNGKFYDFYHFDKLPLSTLVEYGERDTRLCYRLGMWQLDELTRQNRYFERNPSSHGHDLYTVLRNERELTKTFFKIERRGIRVDIPFVKEALQHANKGIRDTLKEIDVVAEPFMKEWNAKQPHDQRLHAMDWNSGPMLKLLFESLGIPYAYTEKGTASFDRDALEKSKHPLAARILEYRRHSKRAHTYFENYLWLSDTDGVLHCSFSTGGPRTGRISCREPNLQNVPKRADKAEADFVVRRCFIPRAGKVLVSKDYDQVEYRLMLDYAGEETLIRKILDEGLDVHGATAAELSLESRDDAKTMNFLLLYGGGVPLLANTLFEMHHDFDTLKAIWFSYKYPNWKTRGGYEKDQATVRALDWAAHKKDLDNLKAAEAKLNHYFKKLPAVENFISKVKHKAKSKNGAALINTWLGRIQRYGDVQSTDASGKIKTDDTSYKAPNGLIQGGAGDLSKVAVNRCQKFLEEKSQFDSGLVLHVHDELVTEIDLRELDLAKPLVEIMEKSYPHKRIPLTAGAAWSAASWGDLEDGFPQ